MKRDLKPIKVSLTGGNINQLKKGNATLLKHAQLDESKGTVTLYLRPHIANKLHRAFTKNKGVKLQMIPDEFRKSFSDGGGKITYKKNIKPIAGPILKEVVKKAIPAAAAAVTGYVQPELAPVAAVIASQYADKGSTALGKATGGWGCKKGKGTKETVKKVAKQIVKKAAPVVAATLVKNAGYDSLAPVASEVTRTAISGLGAGDVEHLRRKPASHGLNFIDPKHPGWNPGPGLKDNSDDRPIRTGGSFKPAGGYGIHPAMNPTRDQSDLRGMRL